LLKLLADLVLGLPVVLPATMPGRAVTAVRTIRKAERASQRVKIAVMNAAQKHVSDLDGEVGESETTLSQAESDGELLAVHLAQRDFDDIHELYLVKENAWALPPSLSTQDPNFFS